MTTAAEIARVIQSDFGDAVKGIEHLASCGTHGKHSSNTERDFWAWAKGAYNFHLQPYQIKVHLHVA